MLDLFILSESPIFALTLQEIKRILNYDFRVKGQFSCWYLRGKLSLPKGSGLKSGVETQSNSIDCKLMSLKELRMAIRVWETRILERVKHPLVWSLSLDLVKNQHFTKLPIWSQNTFKEESWHCKAHQLDTKDVGDTGPAKLGVYTRNNVFSKLKWLFKCKVFSHWEFNDIVIISLVAASM